MGYLLFAAALFSAVLVFGIGSLIVFIKIRQQFWKKKNVYTLNIRVPLVGQLGKVLLRKTSFPGIVAVNFN